MFKIKNYDHDGLFLKAELYQQTIYCLIDTGASLSVLHTKVFTNLPDHCKAKLKPFNNQLKLADGHKVKPLGSVKIPLYINDQIVHQTVIVADIDIPLVLGYDFMFSNECVVDIPNQSLIINNKIIHCVSDRQFSGVFRISVEKNVTIPAGCESIVYTKPIGDKPPPGANFIVDETSQALKNKGIMTAKTLYKMRDERLPLRVINVTDQPLTLYKNMCASTAQLISENDIIDDLSSVTRTLDPLPDHLKLIADKCEANLTKSEYQTVQSLLKKNSAIFADSKNDLGHTNIVQHTINTGNAMPVKQNPRRIPLAQRKEVEDEIQRMLDNNIIHVSQSPWSSPIVVVKKKDNSIRLCIDYRKVNSVTIKDSYPLPRIDDCLDSLRGNIWFSTIDLASGYHQLSVDPRDAPKTAFVTSKGLFEFYRMPFGMCNAGATFSRLMEHILSGLQWETCVVYLDDIIVYSRSFEEHMTRLQDVFTRISNAGLKIAPKKCFLFQRKVSFLGHVVDSEGISPDPVKIEAIKTWPTPTNVKEVRSLLGTCSYYRKFIQDFAKIARPLHRLTEKNLLFRWTTDCEHAFSILKNALTTSPILTYPNMEKEFILDTDASGTGVGAVLSQISDSGVECVIAYFSKALSKTERQYCVTRRELLAIVLAVKHFHHYLYGTKFMVRTDHGALNWLQNFKNPEGQLARWLEILGTYNFIIKHRAGLKHSNADGLSRRPCSDCSHCKRKETLEEISQNENPTLRSIDICTDDEIEPTTLSTNWVNAKTVEQLQQAQLNDPVIKIVHEWKQNSEKPKWAHISHLSKDHKSYWSQWDRLVLKEGVLYRQWVDNTTGEIKLQYVLPIVFRDEVLQLLHNDQTAGHLAYKRTMSRVRPRFYWAGYTLFTERWCKQCNQCQKRNIQNPKTRAEMKLYVVGEPLERVALDILGPVPKTHDGNKYILVITDYFTRFAEAYSLPDIEAKTVANKLVTEFICRYGVPLQIHSDQGAQFTSELFTEMCKKLKIDKTRNSPFHPQSSGLVERLNRTIEEMISKFVSENQKDWDQYLPFLMMAYRSAIHETLGESPGFMMFGREVQLPIDLIFGCLNTPSVSKPVPDYVKTLTDRLEKVHTTVRDRLVNVAERQKRRYDLTCSSINYKVGEAVLLNDPRKYKGRSKKFQMKWTGPYTVIQVMSNVLYQIQEGPKSVPKIVHVNRLKPYLGTMKKWYQPKEGPSFNTRSKTQF